MEKINLTVKLIRKGKCIEEEVFTFGDFKDLYKCLDEALHKKYQLSNLDENV